MKRQWTLGADTIKKFGDYGDHFERDMEQQRERDMALICRLVEYWNEYDAEVAEVLKVKERKQRKTAKLSSRPSPRT